MAGASLLALLDDIASVLDDVAVMTKVAARKTAGVLGDDLALNAQQVAGVRAERELPVVWAVALGSARNKLLLVPSALALSALLPWLIDPLLMLGGAYLCYEGVEKLSHRWLHPAALVEAHAATVAALDDPGVDIVSFERDKIRGAVRTDFILSAEIIVIALGTVQQQPLGSQLAVLASVAVLMTVGVYGLVAAIVKLDDAGVRLLGVRGEGTLPALVRGTGRALLALAPWLLKFLSFAGTVAMFLVGGGILAHGLVPAHALLHVLQEAAAAAPAGGTALRWLTVPLFNALLGMFAGALVLGAATAGAALLRRLARR